MPQPPTRLEEAAQKLAKLLRWGLKPKGIPKSQQCEWPYRLSADGDRDLQVLSRHLKELDDALKERGMF